MSPSVDPVAFVLGVFGLWICLGVVLLAGWIAAAEFFAWRARRALARLAREPTPIRLGVLPRHGVELELEDVSWRWPQRP